MDKDQDQEPPFPREPWQRLLQDRADSPPETTDARIRAAARKAVTPKLARGWLPASLAASFLLAVLIVQSQYGNDQKPAVVTESDLAAPAASTPPPAAVLPDLPRERATASAEAARKESASSELHYEMAPEDFAAEPEADSELGEVTAKGARISGPEQELRTASEMNAEDTASPAPAQADAAPMAGAHSGITSAIAEQPAAKARTPEAWYAEIETLRKAGQIAEADAELVRFEAAYPEWLKQQGRRKP